MNKFCKYILKNKTTINLMCAITALGINLITNFFLSPYIVQKIGVEANGFVQLANNFITIASLITITLNSMAGRFVSLNYNQGKIEEAKKYYSSVFVGNIMIIALLIIPATIIVNHLESILKISPELVCDVKVLFACIFTNFFIGCMANALGIAEFVKNEIYINQIINMIANICRVLTLVGLFTLFLPKVFFVGLATCISTFIMFPMLLIAKKKIFSDVKFDVKCFDWKCIKELISTGIWNTINQCGMILNTGLDLLLSNIFLNQFDMGVLAVSKTAPTIITSLAGTICSAYTAELTLTYAKENLSVFLKRIESAMKVSSVLISVPVMLLVVLGNRFYSLWQPTMDAQKLAILSFLACAPLIPMCGTQILSNVFTVTNKLKVNSLSVVLCGILNIVMVVLSLEYTNAGLYAVAGISSIIQILRNMIYTVPYAAKYLNLGWKYFYKDVLTSILCCVTSGVIFAVMQLLFKVNSWITLIIISSLGCVISVILNMYWVLNKDERKILVEKVIHKNRMG